MARQVLVDTKDIRGDSITILGKEARHLSRVLRVTAGDRLTLFDGKGGRFQGVVDQVTTQAVKVKIGAGRSQAREPVARIQITLVQAILKQKGMETIVSQCTQLGVARIVPVLTKRTEVKLDSERSRHKLERWSRVAQEAAKQCGLSRIPTLEEPTDVQEFLRRLEPHDLSLIPNLEGSTRPLREVLDGFEKAHQGEEPIKVCIMIGPEGDFTAAEVQEAAKHDFKSVSLGPNVLRATTAATVTCAIVQYALG